MLNMSSLSCFFRPHLRQHDASHIAATDTALFTPLMQVKSFRLFCVVIPSQSSSFFVGLVLKSSGAIMFRYSTVVHSSSWYNDRVSCSSRLATKACIFSLFSWWIDRIFPHFLLHSASSLFSVTLDNQPTSKVALHRNADVRNSRPQMDVLCVHCRLIWEYPSQDFPSLRAASLFEIVSRYIQFRRWTCRSIRWTDKDEWSRYILPSQCGR